jgi:molecular chaperone DnaJ
MRDLYAALGVDRKATTQEIKRAYRQLAHRFHPDKNPNDLSAEERFKEVTRAYTILSHTDQRRKYDRFWPAGNFSESAAGFGQNVSDVFSEMFADFFGKKTARKAGRGQDRRLALSLEFRTAVLGGTEVVEVPRHVRCTTCSGTGARPGSSPQLCHACGGTGQVSLEQGLWPVQKTCTFCHGRGKTITSSCKSCRGRGLIEQNFRLNLKIPAGTEDGAVFRLPGEGEPGSGGSPAGDLEIIVKVQRDPVFSRQGLDLHCQVPISLVQAILGGPVEVPTLDGRVRMRIPPGTQSGKVFRLRGKGVPTMAGLDRGDQHVMVMVETPRNLSERERKLVENLTQLDVAEHYPERDAFWKKVQHVRK